MSPLRKVSHAPGGHFVENNDPQGVTHPCNRSPSQELWHLRILNAPNQNTIIRCCVRKLCLLYQSYDWSTQTCVRMKHDLVLRTWGCQDKRFLLSNQILSLFRLGRLGLWPALPKVLHNYKTQICNFNPKISTHLPANPICMIPLVNLVLAQHGAEKVPTRASQI